MKENNYAGEKEEEQLCNTGKERGMETRPRAAQPRRVKAPKRAAPRVSAGVQHVRHTVKSGPNRGKSYWRHR